MHLTRKTRVQWLQRSLFCLLLLLCGLSGSSAAAEIAPTTAACSQVTIHVAPDLRSILFNRVVVLPLQADDPQLAATLSQALHKSLAQTKKYRLLPQNAGANQVKEPEDGKTVDQQEQALSFGRAIKARGVVHGTVYGRRDNPGNDHATTQTILTIHIRMTDAQTGKTAWSMTITCQRDQYSRTITSAQAGSIMDQGLTKLVDAMVAAGDIFSPAAQAHRDLHSW